MTRRARLAVCISAFQYGGQGTVVEEELEWLRGEFEISLVSEKIQRPVPSGIRAIEITSWSAFPRLNPKLPALLRGFDLVHCHDSLGSMMAAKKAGRPYVVTCHGIAPVRLRHSPRGAVEALITILAYPRLYRAASSIVAISSYIANWAEGFARVQPQLILLGVKEPVGGRGARPPDRKLLYVGEVSRRKGLKDLLSGLSLTSPDVTLDVVGAGDNAPFANFSSRRGLAGRVRFHGVLPDSRLRVMYEEAFCTISASRWEGFGLPLVEGFRVGRPTIARNQGGMREIVERSGAGLLLQDFRQLTQSIEQLGLDWELLSERALNFARAHTWRDTFGAYERLFNQILELTA